MDEIHSDNGCTEEELDHDPWLNTDWQDLFERVAGSSEVPLQSDTVALAVSGKYGCNQEFGETITEKAAECGQLLRISLRFGGLRWEYYAAKSDVVSEPCNWVSIGSPDVLADPESLAPEVVSRDELVERMGSKSPQVPPKQAQYIADNIERLAPFYIDGDHLKLQPQICESILLHQLQSRLSGAISQFTPAEEGPAFTRVLEALGDYKKAQKQLAEPR